MRVKNSAVLGEMVYENIREMILTKQIACGEKIQEQKIEEMLGVSRTPVREAVRRLSNEGIVNLYPNRYAEVVQFDKQSIRELGLLRVTLDCLAAQLAVQNGSNRDFEELRGMALQCEEANQQQDIYKRIQYDCDFHMLLVSISGNKMLMNHQSQLFLKTRLLETTLLDSTTSSKCNTQQHLDIVDALTERSIPKVLEAVQKHLGTFYGAEIMHFYAPVFKC